MLAESWSVGTVRAWSASEGERWSIKVGVIVQQLAMRSTAPDLAVAQENGQITFWNTDTQQQASNAYNIQANTDSKGMLLFSRDGRYLISSSDQPFEKKVPVWDLLDATKSTTLQTMQTCAAIACSTDGAVLAAAGSDGKIQLFATGTWHDPRERCIRLLEGLSKSPG